MVGMLWQDCCMEANPTAAPRPRPFQKFEALARRAMFVPKTEIDRRLAAAQRGCQRPAAASQGKKIDNSIGL